MREKQRSYKRDIKRAFRDCIWDILVYGLLFLIFSGFIVLTFTNSMLAERLGIYIFSTQVVALLFALLALNGVFTAIARRIAAGKVTERSFYAVMLTDEQQRKIFRSLSGQIFLSCVLTFFGVLITVSGFAAYEYYVNGNMTASLVAGVFSCVWLLICIFAYGFEVADLSSKDGFCTVSDRGIITAGKIYRFDASLGDVTRLEKKDDYYLLTFKRRSFFWIGMPTRFPLPCAGHLSLDLEGKNEQAVIVEALEPKQIVGIEKETPVFETVEEPAVEEEIVEFDINPKENTDTAPEIEEKGSANFNTAMFELEDLRTLMEQQNEESAAAEGESDAVEPEDVQAVLPQVEAEEVVNESRMGGGAFLARYILKIFAALLILALILGGVYIYKNGIPQWAQEFVSREETEQEEQKTETAPVSDQEQDTEPEEVDNRYVLWYGEDGAWYFTYGDEDILFVDNNHPLSAEYYTLDKSEPLDAMDKLIEDAQDDGIRLYVVRDYRSYDRQEKIYADEDREEWVVPAGYSEHQSRYAFDMDVNGVEGTSQSLTFEDTDAFEWLVEHCAEYGFILRYPKDKTDVTGRCYEPWHFRYVGTELASYLTENGLVLDEIVKDAETQPAS